MSENTATVESDERPALHVCECCMMKFENGDESSCRDYYGHDHKSGTLAQDYALNPDEEFQSTVSRRCDTCGSEIGAFGTIHVYEPIILDPTPEGALFLTRTEVRNEDGEIFPARVCAKKVSGAEAPENAFAYPTFAVKFTDDGVSITPLPEYGSQSLADCGIEDPEGLLRRMFDHNLSMMGAVEDFNKVLRSQYGGSARLFSVEGSETHYVAFVTWQVAAVSWGYHDDECPKYVFRENVEIDEYLAWLKGDTYQVYAETGVKGESGRVTWSELTGTFSDDIHYGEKEAEEAVSLSVAAVKKMGHVIK